MNQTNICTRGSCCANLTAIRAYAACWAFETPFGSPGRVSWPYSVIQIGVAWWWNHASIDVSKRWSFDSVTFGQSTFWSGRSHGDVGYGCCAQASNRSLGSACASSSANLAGETDPDTPARTWLRPRADVSPIATSACGLPALIPVHAAR